MEKRDKNNRFRIDVDLPNKVFRLDGKSMRLEKCLVDAEKTDLDDGDTVLTLTYNGRRNKAGDYPAVRERDKLEKKYGDRISAEAYGEEGDRAYISGDCENTLAIIGRFDAYINRE